MLNSRRGDALDANIFQVHLGYKEWQTKRLLAAAGALPIYAFELSRGSSHGGIKGTLQHIYGADFVWWRRVHGETLARADVVLPETLLELEQRWLQLIAEWRKWAASINAEGWNRILEYTMFDGSRRSNPLWQIVLHLVNHGTLHGGQVVAMLRQAGTTPPQTDLLIYYREIDTPAVSA